MTEKTWEDVETIQNITDQDDRYNERECHLVTFKDGTTQKEFVDVSIRKEDDATPRHTPFWGEICDHWSEIR